MFCKRKTCIGLTALIVLILMSSAFAEDYYYYSLGEQIPVEASDSLIVAIPDVTKGTLEIDHPCIDQSYPPVSINGRAAEYHLAEGWAPDSAIAALNVWGGVAFANPVLSTPDSIPVYLTDELIVRFEDDTPSYLCEILISGFGCEIISYPSEIYDDFPEEFLDDIWLIPDFIDMQRYVIRATGASGDHLLNVANQFYENEYVEYAVPNFYNNVRSDAMPNDEYYCHQWYLSNPENPGADIDFNRATNFANATDEVIIGVIDVGFDLSHEDIDPSRIGYAYDVAGDDLSDSTNIPDMDVSLPPTTGLRADEVKRRIHGTNVLGLLTAMTNNETGIAGLAPNCKFIVIKDHDNNRKGSSKTTSFGIDVCAVCAAFGNCDIIVAPWHLAKPSDDIEASLKRAHKYHAVTFAPSGNTEAYIKTMEYPGTSEYTIAVGATDKEDLVMATSARGSMLDFVAPGFEIWTIDRMGELGIVPQAEMCWDDGYYCRFQGTSASCAIAAGVGAMVFSHCPDAMVPGMYNYDGAFGHQVDFMRNVFENTCDDMVGYDDILGWDSIYGHGRVNAFKAVYSVSRGDVNNDGIIDVDDAVYLVDYLYAGGPPPLPYTGVGNADHLGIIDIDDVVFIIQYAYAGGPSPREPFFDFDL